MHKYCISNVIIELNVPEWTLHDNLKVFKYDAINTDVYCSAVFEKRSHMPVEKARLILKIGETSIYVYEGSIHIMNNDENDTISDIAVSENWTSGTIFINPEYNYPADKKTVKLVRESIFGALRIVMIAALLQKRGLIIHSSTILWNSKGVMFSAQSGVGKSTHTNLWKQLYGTPILDGDVTACRMVNGVPLVYGLPWCGTSGEFMNYSIPLKAIVFLQQAEKNAVVKLGADEAFIRLAARCFQLPLNDKMMNQFLDIIHEVVTSTDCYLLNCLPDKEAVELVKNCLS